MSLGNFWIDADSCNEITHSAVHQNAGARLAVKLEACKTLGRARADSSWEYLYRGDGEGRGEREGSAVGKAIKKTTAARPRHSGAALSSFTPWSNR